MTAASFPPNKWNLHTYASLKAMSPVGGRDFLVEKLLYKRSIAALVADSGIGKTPWLYQLGLCVAAGKPFLGFEVARGGVLYVDYESAVDQITIMLEDLGRHLGLGSIPKNFEVWSVQDPGRDWSPGKLHEMAASSKPSLIIIDTLSGMFPEIEKGNTEANSILAYLRLVTTRTPCALLFAHHRRKPGRDALGGSTQARLDKVANVREWFNESRGPGSIIARADVRLGLDEGVFADPEIALVMRGYSRLKSETPWLHLARAYDGDEPVGYVAVPGERLLSVEDEAAFRKLPAEFIFSEAMTAYGKSDNPTRQFLKRAIDAGLLEQSVRRGPYRKVGIR